MFSAVWLFVIVDGVSTLQTVCCLEGVSDDSISITAFVYIAKQWQFENS